MPKTLFSSLRAFLRKRILHPRLVYVHGGREATIARARAEGLVTGTMRCTRRECLSSHEAAVWPESVHVWAECARCHHMSCEFTPHPNQP